jgi:hypothetical protein
MNIYEFMSENSVFTYFTLALFVYLIITLTKIIANNNPPED